jgi:hypothetical protein
LALAAALGACLPPCLADADGRVAVAPGQAAQANAPSPAPSPPAPPAQEPLSAAAQARPLTGGAQALSGTAQAPGAAALSPTAEPLDLPALPERPKPIQHTKNNPIEDFTAVTLISAPFTALWCGVAALLVGAAVQDRFPPTFNSTLVACAGAAAGATSVGIGIVSVQWGPRAAPAGPDARTAP